MHSGILHMNMNQNFDNRNANIVHVSGFYAHSFSLHILIANTPSTINWNEKFVGHQILLRNFFFQGRERKKVELRRSEEKLHLCFLFRNNTNTSLITTLKSLEIYKSEATCRCNQSQTKIARVIIDRIKNSLSYQFLQSHGSPPKSKWKQHL